MRRVGEVPYELELLEGSKIHNTFFTPCLKGLIGRNIVQLNESSQIDEEDKVVLIYKTTMDVRERNIKHKRTKE